MSVSDPLIKELKGWTRKLMEYAKEINDENDNLCHFCKCFENCLQKGLLPCLDSIGYLKISNAWHWLEYVAEKNYSSYSTFSLVVEQVKQNLKVHTSIGRLRFLIRICLVRKCLHMPIEILTKISTLATEFYNLESILGDDILREILLSVLLQCSKFNFKLNLRNAAFLDDTWQMPPCVVLELVPCKNLGISVCFTKEKALIVNVDEKSVAAEDNKIEIGDVLDEINGNVINGDSKGKLRKIMRKANGQPIILHIIKYRTKKSCQLYEPIVHLIKSSGIESMKSLIQISQLDQTEITKRNQISKLKNKTLNSGFSVKYCGSVHVGIEGDVKQIEKAIWRLLKSGEIKQVPVKFECLEIGILVTQEIDNRVVCKQSYMEISSCGCTANIPDYFAFIAGETNCNMATKFDAYIFYHRNETEVQQILQSLGQGFQRTHFAV
ncbi:uncharacterized protein LOC105249421 isoform X1 [Camponotus floridanus]|uniref:uncharacterized protein LOC105249421 isoform X1 n=2 Tax=Camponotus floridanus TaxID=104421 RepID=UPI00059DEC74|nr:uncharacterized protein LOC105249421 isoform X1 [Camponotus floridanus]XP_011253182.1 uncharacterized protein LOC105249421 isoform X1 [Camponotus floridanus]XP_025263341.1 uncharacterized protein LOC105249421 isoform X1 [Camponotus floridanus]